MPDSVLIDDAWLREHPLPKPVGGDKNARGSVVVVAGAAAMPGAAILCATATLRAGAGKLQVGACRSIALHVGCGVPEALVFGLDESPAGAPTLTGVPIVVEHANAADALVFGPGMVDEGATAAFVAAMVPGLRVPAVIDAAGLACFTGKPDVLAPLGGRVVLTPHAGEMATMLGCKREDAEADPAEHALRAAREFHAVVALKGEVTHIAAPDGALLRNEGDSIGLATCGSGDVLAGVIGGLLARGADPLTAAAWGVFLHARAGRVLMERIGFGFLAREISPEIPALVR